MTEHTVFGEAGLLRASLLDIPRHLQEHILSLLPAQSLGSLACTCRHVHDLVFSAPAAIWTASVEGILPDVHPALASQDKAAI